MNVAAIRREGTRRFLQKLSLDDCTLWEVVAALRVAHRHGALGELRLCDVLPQLEPASRAPKQERLLGSRGRGRG
ncbi:MAG: hypothetical protein EOO40_00645 [Deltaproteobacteria bacterium]|nr:MAG: hypothetical protein EOO40_00645 [Deltaproteobacteria bacterium]